MIELVSKDLRYTVKKVEFYETKQGVKCLKVKGCLETPVFYKEDSKKAMPSRNYFGNVLIFGEEEYLKSLANEVYDPANEKGVKIEVKRAFVEFPFFMGKVFSKLYILDSDFISGKMNKGKALHTPIEYKLPTPKRYRVDNE